jgi:hypothetical protein
LPFTINRGDGLWLGVVTTFTWSINGTDTQFSMSFTFTPSTKTHLYFISLPYTNSYVDASSISAELTSGKIKEIGRFNPATYRWDKWTWTGATWTGVNFQILPGDGFYLVVSSTFNWAPKLITPEVP